MPVIYRPVHATLLADAALQLYVTCGVLLGVLLGMLEIGLAVLNALPVVNKYAESHGFQDWAAAWLNYFKDLVLLDDKEALLADAQLLVVPIGPIASDQANAASDLATTAANMVPQVAAARRMRSRSGRGRGKRPHASTPATLFPVAEVDDDAEVASLGDAPVLEAKGTHSASEHAHLGTGTDDLTATLDDGELSFGADDDDSGSFSGSHSTGSGGSDQADQADAPFELAPLLLAGAAACASSPKFLLGSSMAQQVQQAERCRQRPNAAGEGTAVGVSSAISDTKHSVRSAKAGASYALGEPTRLSSFSMPGASTGGLPHASTGQQHAGVNGGGTATNNCSIGPAGTGAVAAVHGAASASHCKPQQPGLSTDKAQHLQSLGSSDSYQPAHGQCSGASADTDSASSSAIALCQADGRPCSTGAQELCACEGEASPSYTHASINAKPNLVITQSGDSRTAAGGAEEGSSSAQPSTAMNHLSHRQDLPGNQAMVARQVEAVSSTAVRRLASDRCVSAIDAS